MTAAKVQKLRALLERVERRRKEPRLVSVTGGAQVASANTNETLRTLEVVPAQAPLLAPPSSLPPPSSMPPPALPALDATLRSPPPPPPSSMPPPARRTPSSTLPPEVVPASPRAPTEVLPAAQARIAPASPVPFDSAVRVATPPRIDAPKTFGELLEQSLALRPRA